MTRSYACSDAGHEGDRLIRYPVDAYEVRLEARRLVDQSGRTDIQLVSVICKQCLPARLDEMAGRLPRQSQSSMLFGADLREP